ncbi:MAG: glycerol-3-phosphate 1-O-acyltransferase PlsY [Thermoanaerobaculaceae bacterium]|nr:glycerol-3-phosphate 1-O-acyltransferase PlsY [Thermoanaerobaculaceae bacterium]
MRPEVMLVVGYLVGSIPFAYLFVKLAGRGDVRRIGSGNVGATNALRAGGWKVAVPVALADVGKGVLAVLLMRQVALHPAWVLAAGVAAVLGHCFPVWLRFSGGKGVATAAGVYLTLALPAALAAAAVWVVVLVVFRIVSVASVVAAAAFPALVYLLGQPSLAEMAITVVAAAVIILRHHANIRRLVRGEEPRLWGGKP